LPQHLFLSITQPFTEITDKREAVHGFDRGTLFLSFVVFSLAGRVAKENPIGGFIAGSLESFRTTKVSSQKTG
jgi:hypothetical protein